MCKPCFVAANRTEIIAAYRDVARKWRADGAWVPPLKEAAIVNSALQAKDLPLVAVQDLYPEEGG